MLIGLKKHLKMNNVHFGRIFCNKYSSISAKNSIKNIWKPVIGLEIHAQIKSATKLFTRIPTSFEAPPNNNVGIFDAAHPGTLPVLNKRCVEAALLTALSLGLNINKKSTFDRKHYFYPDIPAGYQITQRYEPIAKNGKFKFTVQTLDWKFYEKEVDIIQLQLEEDTGKMLHYKEKNKMLVDLNRAGMPLMELVFGPNLSSAQEAVCLVRDLSIILKKIGTCSCRMSEGALRVDVNVSVHKSGEPYGVRTELKNLRDVKDIFNAINHEIDRQINVLENGGEIINETRGYNEEHKSTHRLRDKEVFQDYRYMPEPNLPPLRLHNSMEDKRSKNHSFSFDYGYLHSVIPQTPICIKNKLISKYNISPLNAYNFSCCYEGVQLLENIYNENNKRDPNIIVFVITCCIKADGSSLTQSFPQWITKDIVCELVDLYQEQKISEHNMVFLTQHLCKSPSLSPLQVAQENNWYTDLNEWVVELEQKLDILFQDDIYVGKIIKLKIKGKDKRLLNFVKASAERLFKEGNGNISKPDIITLIQKRVNKINI